MNGEGRLVRPKLRWERDFVQLPNTWVRDDQLSLKARGLLALMMSHEQGWNVTIKSLASSNPEGVDAIRKAVEELAERGYLDRTQTRTRRGLLGHVWWSIVDPHDPSYPQADSGNPRSEPLWDYPSPDNPSSDEPSSDNPTTKEDHLKNTYQDLKSPTTDAGGSQEARSVPETPADRYRRLIAAHCPGRRNGRQHRWAASGYCDDCGARQPVLEAERVDA